MAILLQRGFKADRLSRFVAPDRPPHVHRALTPAVVPLHGDLSDLNVVDVDLNVLFDRRHEPEQDAPVSGTVERHLQRRVRRFCPVPRHPGVAFGPAKTLRVIKRKRDASEVDVRLRFHRQEGRFGKGDVPAGVRPSRLKSDVLIQSRLPRPSRHVDRCLLPVEPSGKLDPADIDLVDPHGERVGDGRREAQTDLTVALDVEGQAEFRPRCGHPVPGLPPIRLIPPETFRSVQEQVFGAEVEQ